MSDEVDVPQDVHSLGYGNMTKFPVMNPARRSLIYIYAELVKAEADIH